MRKIGVIAAALATAFSIGFASRGLDDRDTSPSHSCGAIDKRFIRTASVDMTELGIWAAAHKDGSAGPEAVAKEAGAAAKRVAYVHPAIRRSSRRSGS